LVKKNQERVEKPKNRWGERGKGRGLNGGKKNQTQGLFIKNLYPRGIPKHFSDLKRW